MILSRPVTNRAIRIAFSLASAPALVKKTFSKPAGACSRILPAASARCLLEVDGATIVITSACLRIAATTRGCW